MNDYIISKALRDELLNAIYSNHKTDTLAMQEYSKKLILALQNLPLSGEKEKEAKEDKS